MPVASLLSAAPINLPAKVRLRYVLAHFQLAYPGGLPVKIGYAGTQPQVEITEATGKFFEGNNPYPAAPTWRDWVGRQIPFFFDNAPEKPLLIFRENRVIISADIISAAFYLLSGWQEYFSTERDQHGRFPYAASVQKQHGFVTLPVVNYYFDVLKTAVEYLSGQPLLPRRWGNKQSSFAAFVSHDIDNLYSAWKNPAKLALKQGKLSRFAWLLGQRIVRPDAWDNLEEVVATAASYGAKSTLFLLLAKGKAINGIPNADYRLNARLWQRLGKLNCALELHGSIGTATDAQQLLSEDELLDAIGVRFHYLSWDPAQTLTVVERAGLLFDSTLGFAEHFGFRHSYCQPFFPFNFETSKATSFLEIPLNVMDATLHHPRYLQLAPAEILPALAPVFAEIKRFGGVASVLWHNENFDPNNTQNGPQQFHEIMHHLQHQGAAFLTGREVWKEFTADPTPDF